MKKWPYYHVDCGHFPVQIKLCFSDKDFQMILQDHGIQAKATALEEGIAETHYLTDGKQGIIILVFDLEECDEGAILAGTVAHEATHCVCRVFEHIGEEPEDIGEESRAYLTEHIVKQITQAIVVYKAQEETKKNAGKRNRKVSKQTGEGKEGAQLQVDINNNGSAGQDSDSQRTIVLYRAEDSDGTVIGKAKDSI